MFSTGRSPASARAFRRDLLVRTALYGALASLGAALLVQPAEALPELAGTPAQMSLGGAAPAISSGGAETDVTLHAPRTVIDWTRFDIDPGETVKFGFDARNWIVLNRVTGPFPSQINGTMQGLVGPNFGGNIWVVSPAGIVFGGSARVDAGGLLATTATADLNGFLNPNNLQFAFSGDPDSQPSLSVSGGARLSAHGGSVALVSPVVVTGAGSSVTADGSVLYGGAQAFQIHFTQQTAGDLDLVDFIVPDANSGSPSGEPLDIEGNTAAKSIYIAAVSQPGVASAVINVTGLVSAQSASVADGGDVVLSGGGGIVGQLPGPPIPSSAPTDIYLTQASASRDVLVQTTGSVYGYAYQPPPPPPPPPEAGNGSSNSGNGSSNSGNGSSNSGNGSSNSGNGSSNSGNGSSNSGNGSSNSGNGSSNSGNGGNGFSNGSNSGNGFSNGSNGGWSPVHRAVARADVPDPSVFSTVTATRNVHVQATAQIDLGSTTAGNDIVLQAASVQANSLRTGAGTLSVSATSGPAHVASASAGGDVSITATGDATLDKLSLTGTPATHAVTLRATGSGADASLGDGSTALAGPATISLFAAQDATLNVPDTAGIGTVSAGGASRLTAGALTGGGTVTTGGAANLNATAGDINLGAVTAGGSIVASASGAASLGSATSANDLYVYAANGSASVGSGTVGDDIYIMATNGTASLGSGTSTNTGPDAISPSSFTTPDTDRNGRIISIQARGANADALLGQGTGSVSGATAVYVQADRDAVVDLAGAANPTSVKAGRDATLRGTTVTLQTLQAGRDVTIAATGGGFTSSQPLSAVGNITVSATGALQTADVTAQNGSAALTGASVNAGAVSAAQDLTLRGTSGPVTVSSYRAGRDLTLQGTTISLGGAIAPVGRDLSVTTTADFVVGYDLVAGRNAGIASTGRIDLQGLTATGGTAQLTGASIGAKSITAGQDVRATATGALQSGAVVAGGSISFNGSGVTTGALSAGSDVSLYTAGALQTGAITAARLLNAVGETSIVTGAITANQDVNLTSNRVQTGAVSSAAGSIAIVGLDVTTGALTAAQSVSAPGGGSLKAGDVTATSGSISLTGVSIAAGTLNAGQDITLGAITAVQVGGYKAARDLTVRGTTISLGQAAAPVGRDLSITAGADFNAAYDLSAGRNATVTGSGAVSLKNLTAGGAALLDVQGKASVGTATAGALRVLAGDLDISGGLTAPTVQVESRTGALQVGGSTAPASGLWLDNAEFGRIKASNRLDLYAGSTTGTGRGDLTLLDLDVNPANTPQVDLYAGNASTARVQGSVAPTTSGGGFRIGGAADLTWRPGSILITGALGTSSFTGGAYTAVRAFDNLHLAASQDVLMGSQRFISLIQATAPTQIDISHNLPAGAQATGSELNRVFVTSGRLEVSGAGKIVQQNTSAAAGVSEGIYLTNTGSPALVVDPPQIVDLFGAFIDRNGKLVNGLAGALTLDVAVVGGTGTPVGIPTGAAYRFNGCVFGTSCATTSGSTAGGPQQGYQVSTSEQAFQLDRALVTEPAETTESTLLAVAPSEQAEYQTDPVVTGTGNEEIWRKREGQR